MSSPYIGEIRMFAGNFPPNGWAFCNGQTLAISENDTLFQLIGTTYGGDGEETFNLPNLQSRLPIHMGTGPDGTTYQLAEMAGTETVTLTAQQTPLHTHTLIGSTNIAQNPQPDNAVLAQGPAIQAYINGAGEIPLASNSVTPLGGNQPHENVQPFMCINFIISLFGIFPSQT